MAAYLNAKFHISKDLAAVLAVRKGEREYAKAGKMPILYRRCDNALTAVQLRKAVKTCGISSSKR